MNSNKHPAMWPVAPGAWRKYDEMESRLTAPVSERMLDLAKLAAGMRVLDIGSGTGEPALRAARRISPGGFVTGIDAADGMLQMAREKAARAGISNVEFRCVDAQEFAVPPGVYDIATARWSLMYMADPEQALKRIRCGLKPQRCLIAAFWAEPERVEYATLARRVLARFRDVPHVAHDSPGVFRYADESTIQRSLNRGGFTIEGVEELRIPVVEVDDGQALVTWILAFAGPVARLVSEMPAERQRSWAAEILREAERYRDAAKLRLGGVTRLVLART